MMCCVISYVGLETTAKKISTAGSPSNEHATPLPAAAAPLRVVFQKAHPLFLLSPVDVALARSRSTSITKCDAVYVVCGVLRHRPSRHSTATTAVGAAAGAALLRVIFETPHALLVPPLVLVALTPLVLPDHQVIGCVVCLSLIHI